MNNSDMEKLELAIHCLGEMCGINDYGNPLTVIAELQKRVAERRDVVTIKQVEIAKDLNRSLWDKMEIINRLEADNKELRTRNVALSAGYFNDKATKPAAVTRPYRATPAINDRLERGILTAMILDWAYEQERHAR